MTGVYYNEIDPKAAAWLRELINKGHIAPGEVDERSIVDLRPAELAGFAQCHFFAGIGVWSYALRNAGWADNRPVWTGSCPCQPFSQAGKGAGAADDRHLWPYWEHLIRELRPSVIYGEQVASKAADSWADLVQDDLEALDYAFGAVPFPAAGVGAPHIRDRLYWVAHNSSAGRGQERADGRGQPSGDRAQGLSAGLESGSSSHQLADPYGRNSGTEREQRGGEHRFIAEDRLAGERLADDDSERCDGQQVLLQSGQPRQAGAEATGGGRAGVLGNDDDDAGLEGRGLPAGERRGECSPWAASDFVWCRDGKWRPVEPGSFPLAHGAPARVGRLRGYGNAIVSQAAKVFIEASGLV